MERVGQGTWFAIDRKIFSSDLWFASPWKLKIFIYLLGNANHEPGHFMGVDIDRGELIRSYRTIQSDCSYKIGYRIKKPSFDTVRRICEELTKESRIVQRTVHCGTLFKIINYNELQPNYTQRTVQRKRESSFNDRSTPVHNNNNKNNNKIKDNYSDDFLKFWETYPRKVGKDAAYTAWVKRNGTRPSIEIILEKLNELKISEQWTRDNGQYIPHPSTWINRGGWADELTISPEYKQRISPNGERVYGERN